MGTHPAGKQSCGRQGSEIRSHPQLPPPPHPTLQLALSSSTSTRHVRGDRLCQKVRSASTHGHCLGSRPTLNGSRPSPSPGLMPLAILVIEAPSRTVSGTPSFGLAFRCPARVEQGAGRVAGWVASRLLCRAVPRTARTPIVLFSEK